jgi:hypothetical protein
MGSAGRASANKYLGHVHLKRPGTWCDVTNATQMLAWCCATGTAMGSRVFDRDR